jgi:ATP-binding cassette subfamily F protein uup
LRTAKERVGEAQGLQESALLFHWPMMLSLVNTCLAFGGPPLLDKASMQINPGDRLALIGRNGSGKSSLLKILSGELLPDSGERILQDKPLITTLPQQIPEFPGEPVDAYLRHSLDSLELEAWEVEARLDKGMRDLGMPPGAACADLSSGQKRRLLLLAALVRHPDILLLDEPTNHLDVETIRWMEGTLRAFPGALLFISHDRAFIRSQATAILDLDRGRLTRWDCPYDAYLERKAEALEAESRQQAVFDKKLAQEEA